MCNSVAIGDRLKDEPDGLHSMMVDFGAGQEVATRRVCAVTAALGLLAASAGGLVADRASAKEAVVWIESYEEAIEVARKTGKPIFLEYRCAP